MFDNVLISLIFNVIKRIGDSRTAIMTRYTRAGYPKERKLQTPTPWSELAHSQPVTSPPANAAVDQQSYKKRGPKNDFKRGKEKKNFKRGLVQIASGSSDSVEGADYRYSTKKPKKKAQWQKTEWELLELESDEAGLATDLLKMDEESKNPRKFKAKKRNQKPDESKSLDEKLRELQSSMGAFSEQEKKELAEFVKKDTRREARRVKRVDAKIASKTCYNCREIGHDMADCPKMKTDMEQGAGICFKCGSTEHAIYKCHVKLPPGEFPYAKCFICGEQGHLSKQCPDNPRGLYPNGGCCRICGSVEHYKKDCPELQKEQGLDGIKVTRMKVVGSIDEEESLTEVKPVVKKSKPKIVKF